MVSIRGFKIPTTLARCADLLYTTKAKRLELEGEVEKLKDQETALKNHLINELPKDDASGISGAVARAVIKSKSKPKFIKDTGFDDAWEWARNNDAPEIFQRRLNEAAVSERWAAGEEIPGIELFHYKDVSLTKV
jgi:hypothetical protein